MTGNSGRTEQKAAALPRRVLVCLDGSAPAEKVLPHVRKQAELHGGRLTLLRVVEASERTGSVRRRAFAWSRQIEGGARSYLDRIASSLRERGVSAESRVVSARRATAGEGILSYADAHKMDLIALTTHGQSGLAHSSAGSVSGYVMRHCRVPLLVLKLR